MKCVDDSGEVASSLVWPARLSSTLQIWLIELIELYNSQLHGGDGVTQERTRRDTSDPVQMLSLELRNLCCTFRQLFYLPKIPLRTWFFDGADRDCTFWLHHQLDNIAIKHCGRGLQATSQALACPQGSGSKRTLLLFTTPLRRPYPVGRALQKSEDGITHFTFQ
jgi:hypothetical protein